MKPYVKIFFSITLCGLLAAGCAALPSEQTATVSRSILQQTSDTTTMRTVQVSGMGETQVEPDTAVIDLGVQTQEKTAQAALTQNNTKMQALVDALKKAKIPSENIQTQTIRLSPRYQVDKNNNQTLEGYTASNVVEVRTTDLESVGTLLDQAVNAGANTIQNINFEVSNSQKVLDQVRESAVQDAQHKAEQLAKLTNTTLGPIVEIQESSNTPGPIVRQVQAPAESAAVPVSPGTQTVSVQVQVTWSLVVNTQQ